MTAHGSDNVFYGSLSLRKQAPPGGTDVLPAAGKTMSLDLITKPMVVYCPVSHSAVTLQENG